MRSTGVTDGHVLRGLNDIKQQALKISYSREPLEVCSNEVPKIQNNQSPWDHS